LPVDAAAVQFADGDRNEFAHVASFARLTGYQTDLGDG
jgi:hypothetical protein